MRKLKYIHNMKAQELIDEVIYWEEMKKKVRKKEAKETERKFIENIAWMVD